MCKLNEYFARAHVVFLMVIDFQDIGILKEKALIIENWANLLWRQ